MAAQPLGADILGNLFRKRLLPIFPRCAAPSRSAAHLGLRFAPGRPDGDATGQDPFGDECFDPYYKRQNSYCGPLVFHRLAKRLGRG
jgi:hypothetical protein